MIRISTYTKIYIVELFVNLRKRELLAFEEIKPIEVRKSCNLSNQGRGAYFSLCIALCNLQTSAEVSLCC